jgi:glycosyltransferase involved in cell wall biosynthesis
LHRSFLHRILSFLSFMVSSFFAGLRVRDVDIIWGTSPPIFQGFTAWLLASIKKKPFLFEIRDLWPAFAIAVGVLRHPLLIKASEWLEKFLYAHADLVVVNSPGFIEHTRARGAKRVELVPNGADTSMFSENLTKHRSFESSDYADKYVVVYAGAHGMSNDLVVVLQAAHQLQSRPDIRFLLIGDGKEKPALQNLATELTLTNLEFLPPVPKNKMASTLAVADACIAILKPIPLYATVYPNKVFDYMAAGKPVLLAIEGVIQDVVEAAGAGLIIPPGDPNALAEGITYMADHENEGIEMGIKGREYIKKHFDRPIQAEKFAQLMCDLSKSVKV